eukprot:m.179684 g.179684  ORF g.179684 m.179684 type:complete len:398 (-) comp21448_c4_seq5:110-1303(-)
MKKWRSANTELPLYNPPPSPSKTRRTGFRLPHWKHIAAAVVVFFLCAQLVSVMLLQPKIQTVNVEPFRASRKTTVAIRRPTTQAPLRKTVTPQTAVASSSRAQASSASTIKAQRNVAKEERDVLIPDQVGIGQLGGTALPRGVADSQVDRKGLPNARAALYEEALGRGHFSCERNGRLVQLSYSTVNDDFCDCDSGVDEPGTSACPNSKFFCKPEGSFLLSSRVNDGVCDCCDGSDEWQNSIPCPARCESLLQARRAAAERAEAGKALRAGWVSEGQQAAQAADSGKKSHWGPDFAFFKMQDTCLSHKDGEFTYSVCFFKNVQQTDHTGKKFHLGRSFQWRQYPHIGVFSQGDGCPNNVRRSAQIDFSCGTESRILSVAEQERCSYIFNVQSPGACV